MDAFDADELVAAIEASQAHQQLEAIDDHLELYDERMTFEIAQDTAAQVFNPDISPDDYDFSQFTVYNAKPFSYYDDSSPVTVFDDFEPGHDAYELIGDGGTLYIVFETSHGTTDGLDTRYRRLDLRVPTFEAYVEHVKRVLGEDALPNHEHCHDHT